jgi:hypothetical protein
LVGRGPLVSVSGADVELEAAAAYPEVQMAIHRLQHTTTALLAGGRT